MKKRTRGTIAVLLVLSMVMALLPAGVAFAASDTVTVYHTNDMHGYIYADYNSETNAITKPGLDYVATLHAEDENSLLVDSGDWSQGTIFANLAYGLSCVEAMNTAGYDVAILGNHEFDFSVATLEENLKAADFDVISANVSIDSAHAADLPELSAMPAYVIKEVGGHKIAFFGIDTPELNGMVSPATLSAGGVSVRTDISTLAAEIVAQIKSDVPDVGAIIAMTHCGYSEPGASNNESSYDIAKVDGITAVIDGHDHALRLGSSAIDVDGTLIVSTGTQLYNVGKLELTFSGGKVSVKSSDAAEDAMAAEPMAAVTEVIDKWNAEFEEIKSEVVFSSEVNIWGGNIFGLTSANEEVKASIARRGETNGGSLVGDARLWKAENWLAENYNGDLYKEYGLTADMPVVVLTGGGSVRGSFKAGEVTLGDMMTAYAFGFDEAEDTYVLITPKIMYLMIEHGVNIFSDQDDTGMLVADGSIHGRFPQAAGFTYEYDITQPASSEYDKDNLVMPTTIGSRVQKITLDDGTVLDPNDDTTKLLCVTSDYEIGGGDSYWMLGVLNDSDNYGGFEEVKAVVTPAGNYGDAIIDYVNDVYDGVLPADAYPLQSGRITRVNDTYTGSGFEPTITVTTDGTAALANTELDLYINGEKSTVTTDGDGMVVISLDNGPSEIRLMAADGSFDSGSVYLDNYCGLYNAVVSNNPEKVLPTASSGSETVEPAAEEKDNSFIIIIVIVVLIALLFALVAVSSKKNKAANDGETGSEKPKTDEPKAEEPKADESKAEDKKE